MNLASLLLVSALLFGIGLFGFLARRNIIAALIGIELMLNASIINLVAFSRFGHTDAAAGPVFALFIIAITSAEMAVALALVVSLHRKSHDLRLENLTKLRDVQ